MIPTKHQYQSLFFFTICFLVISLITISLLAVSCSPKVTEQEVTTTPPAEKETEQVTSDTPTPSEIFRSGLITEDETWFGTVHVTGDVTMREGFTLTILPGTTVLFAAHQDDQHSGSAVPLDEYIAQHNDPTWTLEYNQSHSGMDIYGNLIAKGTSEKPIVFTSDSPTPDAGDWVQIHFGNDSVVEYCIVEYARGGLDVKENTGESVLITHNIIRHVLWTSIAIHSSSPVISYNEIFHGGGHGGITVLGEDSNPLITNNIFRECKAGLGIFEGSSAIVEHNIFIDNDTGGISVNRGGDSTIIRYNSISCPNGPSMYTTYQGKILYPSYILMGESSTFDGISIVDSSPTISNNEIFQCNNAGINIYGESSPIINKNTIRQNNMGILFDQSFSGSPTISMNNILDNDNSNIALRSAESVDVIDNWWETTDPTEIQDKLHDIQDQPAFEKVAFEPFLTEPVKIE